MTTATPSKAKGSTKAAREQEYVDKSDPFASFLRDRLGMDWLKAWFFAFLIFGIFEKIILPSIGGYLNLSGSIKTWTPHVESLLTGFVEFPFFFGYYLWSGSAIVHLLNSLEENKSFEDPRQFKSFRDDMLKAYDSPWPAVIGLVFAIAGMLLMHFVVWGPKAVVPPWFGDRLYARILSLIFIGIVAYIVFQIFYREIVSVTWLRRLWAERSGKLVIHPYHADGAGGLGGIGSHAVGLFIFFMILLLFIFMATVLPSFLASTTPDSKISLRLWSPLLVAIWVAYLTLLPLMYFLLIWPPRQAMIRERDRRINDYSTQLDEQLKKAQGLAVNDRSKLEEVYKDIKNLKDVRSLLLEDYPIWPVSTQSKRLFGLTSALPSVYSFLTVVFELLK
jgi:hypothetical protein